MNDRMLRHNQLNNHFFMDAFFVTKKATKSTRGNTCCQLFVIDESFVHVEPLWKRNDLMHALSIFTKDIGVPEVLIVDGKPEENSAETKTFFKQV